MRDKNWPIILNDFITQHKNKHFEWGVFDCCLFVANAVRSYSDIDIAANFRGRYKSAKGAKKALVKYGEGSIKGTVTSILGPFKPRLNAGRGDVVLIDSEFGEALGIVWAGKIWATNEEGLITLPMNKALVCWSVPCQ